MNNTNICFEGHVLWEEFGKHKQQFFKTPNIFCNILLQYYDKIPALKNITKAIETGTYQGHTAMCLSKLFDTVDTIELFVEQNPYNKKSLKETYEIIKQTHKNITFYGGSSIDNIKIILEENKDETFFILLDAHTFEYSPMIDELKMIKKYSNKNDHLIMIDDCVFLGKHGYPSFEELIKAVIEINPEYKITNTFQGNSILLIHT